LGGGSQSWPSRATIGKRIGPTWVDKIGQQFVENGFVSSNKINKIEGQMIGPTKGEKMGEGASRV
jgi:hypothetical protein